MNPEGKLYKRLERIAKAVLPPHPISVLHGLIPTCVRDESSRVSILDIGFGFGFHWVSNPKDRFPFISVTSLDAISTPTNSMSFPPDKSLVGVVPEALKLIPDRSFNLVMAFDLIEHLPRHEGYLLIYEMQRIAKNYVVVFTPNGHVWQPPLPDNPFQAHVSGWTPRDFASLGFRRIQGMRGFRWFYGPMSRRKFLPKSKIVSGLVAPLDRLACLMPRLSFSFTAVYRNDPRGIASIAEVENLKTG